MVDVTVYPAADGLSFTEKFSVTHGLPQTLVLRNGQHVVYDPVDDSVRLVGHVVLDQEPPPRLGAHIIRGAELVKRDALNLELKILYGDKTTENVVLSSSPGATALRTVKTQRDHILTVNLTTGKVLVVRGTAHLPPEQKAQT